MHVESPDVQCSLTSKIGLVLGQSWMVMCKCIFPMIIEYAVVFMYNNIHCLQTVMSFFIVKFVVVNYHLSAC